MVGLTGLTSFHFVAPTLIGFADRHTPVCLSLVVKPASRRFASNAFAFNTKNPTARVGFSCVGRIDWTRTSDLFDPNEAFYQAELQSDKL